MEDPTKVLCMWDFCLNQDVKHLVGFYLTHKQLVQGKEVKMLLKGNNQVNAERCVWSTLSKIRKEMAKGWG